MSDLETKVRVRQEQDILDRIVIQKRKSKKGITVVEVIVIIAIIVTLAAIIYGVIVNCLNEQNRITEGIIVDKSYIAERVITDYRVIGETQIPFTHREPAHYYFQLEGEKDEEKVRYWVEVSEYDYNEYKIGNYYKL